MKKMIQRTQEHMSLHTKLGLQHLYLYVLAAKNITLICETEV